MARNPLLHAPTYDPNLLLDTVTDLLGLDTDAALSQALGIAAPNISHMRHHDIPIGPSMLVRMHEETGLDIADLRKLMGDQRARFRSRTMVENERRQHSAGAEHETAGLRLAVAGAPSNTANAAKKVTRTRRQPHRNDPLYAIVRKEKTAVSTAYWYVQLMRQGRRYDARFYDRAYPGKPGAALEAAQAFREALLELLPLPGTSAEEEPQPDAALVKQIEREVRIRFGEKRAEKNIAAA